MPLNNRINALFFKNLFYYVDIRPSDFIPIYSQERVRQGYCPSLDEELLEDCEEHLARSYVGMLNMIVQVNATFYCWCI